MIHTNDMRALLAVMLRGQDVQLYNSLVTKKIETFDYYLGLAQQLLESSWNPQNYKPPLGSLTQGRVEEAITTLIIEGYTVVYPEIAKEMGLNTGQITYLGDAWKSPPPPAASEPSSST